jgi:hypothetical protein
MSVCPSVRIEQFGSHWTDFHQIWYLIILPKSVQKTQGSLKSHKMTGTVREDLGTCMAIPRTVLLGMRIDSEKKSRRENQNTYFMFS